MSVTIKKLWSEYGIVGVLVIIVVAYGLFMLYNNLKSKGSFGGESMTQTRNPVYNNTSGIPQPSQENNNDNFAPVNAPTSTGITMPSSNQNPSDLLPKDNSSQWAQLNPVGKGDLANVNFLKAGYHIGIDTVGQTLRNANLQLRSEPPNPQTNVGPWNLSTITPDFMRAPLEIGQGSQ